MLRAYHELLGELIPEHDGTLEHFAGDGVMVFFNDPVPVDEHELKAVRFALAAQERFEDLAAAWRKRGTSSAWGSASRPDTRPSAGSASKDATTTACSAPSPTSPRG